MIGVYLTLFPSIPTTETDLVISMPIFYIGWTVFTIALVCAPEMLRSNTNQAPWQETWKVFTRSAALWTLLLFIFVGINVGASAFLIRAMMAAARAQVT